MKIIHVFLNNLVILKAGVAAEFFPFPSSKVIPTWVSPNDFQ